MTITARRHAIRSRRDDAIADVCTVAVERWAARRGDVQRLARPGERRAPASASSSVAAAEAVHVPEVEGRRLGEGHLGVVEENPPPLRRVEKCESRCRTAERRAERGSGCAPLS